MLVKCAVCKKIIGEKEGPKDEITHSYCENCKKDLMKEVEEYKAQNNKS